MASFKVEGPFTIPFTKMKVGRTITKENISAFWRNCDGMSVKRGCYIFAFRAAKGYKPVYIGKATKSFKQEIFTNDKLKKYGDGFGAQAKGTPVMFFVCLSQSKGAVNKSAIDEVESFLIQAGLAANKKLLNDKKTAVESWSIGGIVRFRGKVSKQAQELRQCIKL